MITTTVNNIELTLSEKVVVDELSKVLSKYGVSEAASIQSIVIKQSEAARLLGVSRQRIGQLVNHPEHKKHLRQEQKNVSLSDVLKFEGRNVYSGKRLESGEKPNNEVT